MKTARQEILEKLQNTSHSLPDAPDYNAPVYHPIEKPLEMAFKKSLERVNGSVHLFETENELFTALHHFLQKYSHKNISCLEPGIQKKLHLYNIPYSVAEELNEQMEAGITGCEFLIAHTGSVMVSSAQAGGRQMFVYPPVHIVVARKSQVVEYLQNAYSAILEKYQNSLPSQISLITGPSRTADIEKTLILGAHGPKELHVFLA
ncbi:MAG: lactate utilization protein [Prolixibacteraceae bacterium]|nr:lactate utilization protein [Prolixibacteraceae bacterium]